MCFDEFGALFEDEHGSTGVSAPAEIVDPGADELDRPRDRQSGGSRPRHFAGDPLHQA